MAVLSDLSIDQGADYSADIVVEDGNGNVANLTGYTVAAQMRKSYASSTFTNFGATVANAGQGLLTIEDVMEKPINENLSDFKVLRNEIIENVAEKILTQEKSVSVIDENNQIVGTVHPSKIIHTVFGGKKKND
jgi:ABC-type proline/glycine betaine transport system ATPase subunit